MNTIDFIIIGIVLGSGLIGLLRGFVREVLSILTWIGAAAATYYLFYNVSFIRNFAHGHIASQQIADGVTIAVLFIVSLIICSIISGILSDLVRRSTLGGIDSSLGLAFGLARGVVLIAVCEIVLSAFTPRQNQSQSIQTARFTPLARQISDKVLEILPSNTRSFILSQSHKATANLVPTLPQTDSPPSSQGELQVPVVPSQEPSSEPNSSTPQGEEVVPRPKPPVPGEGSPAKSSTSLNLPSPQAVLPPLPGNSQEQKTAPSQTHVPQDPQKTADALANLKPQVAGEKKNDLGYNQSQRHDMDRLFQTAQ